MIENTRKRRTDRAAGTPRRRYSVGAQLTRDEYARLETEWLVKGCTPSDLVRAALGLDETMSPRPLLIAAGQLIRAGNAHAAATGRDEWKVTTLGLDELNRHAAELIRLAIQERSWR